MQHCMYKMIVFKSKTKKHIMRKRRSGTTDPGKRLVTLNPLIHIGTNLIDLSSGRHHHESATETRTLLSNLGQRIYRSVGN